MLSVSLNLIGSDAPLPYNVLCDILISADRNLLKFRLGDKGPTLVLV